MKCSIKVLHLKNLDMRSVEQSFALISRQLEHSAHHLSRHSSRKDLAEGNYQAIKELSMLQDQLLIMQETLSCDELKISRMQKAWNDQLSKLYLFLSALGLSSTDFFRIIQQPIDFFIASFEAELKSKIPIKTFNPVKCMEEDICLQIEENERQYAMIEQQVENDLMTTKRQIELIINKTLNYEH